MHSHMLRLRWICYFEKGFVKSKNQMKSRFLKRSYPERLFDKQIKKVKLNH